MQTEWVRTTTTTYHFKITADLSLLSYSLTLLNKSNPLHRYKNTMFAMHYLDCSIALWSNEITYFCGERKKKIKTISCYVLSHYNCKVRRIVNFDRVCVRQNNFTQVFKMFIYTLFFLWGVYNTDVYQVAFEKKISLDLHLSFFFVFMAMIRGERHAHAHTHVHTLRRQLTFNYLTVHVPMYNRICNWLKDSYAQNDGD